jgi:hypothetical protein
MELEFEVKKNAKELNILVNVRPNISVVKNVVKSQPINFSGERDTFFFLLTLCFMLVVHQFCKRLIDGFKVRQSSVVIKITNIFCVISKI